MRIYVKTYGIACVEKEGERLEVISEVNNVTGDGELADRLVDLFNKHQLSPQHLADVIEDILAIN